MDSYTRIQLKLNKLYNMKKEISQNTNVAYKKYRDHRVAYAKIKDVVGKNDQFIVSSLVKIHEYDAIKPIAQIKMISYCLSDDLFLHLLAACNMANRMQKACEEKYMAPEIIEKIRACMMVFCN